jgi:hypothetical protein
MTATTSNPILKHVIVLDGQQNNGRGDSMARQRYQHGSVMLRGKYPQQWVARGGRTKSNREKPLFIVGAGPR